MAETTAEAPPPAPYGEEPQAAEWAPEPTSAAPTPRKKRRRGRFTLFLASLGLLVTALGGAAFVFRNQDARLGAIADAIEQTAQNPKAFVLKEKEEIGAWLAEKLPHEQPVERAASAPPAGAESVKAAASVDSAQAAAAPGWAEPQEPKTKLPEIRAQAETAPQTSAPQAPAPKVPPSSPPAPGAIGSAEIAPLLKRLETLEADVRAANEAAAEARRAAEARPAPEPAESPAATASETKTLIAPLEAKINELTQALSKLQQQLEQPKVGTRAQPEVDTPASRPPQQTKALTALQSLALAQALQRALDRSRPYAAELAALRRLGADPKRVSELAPFADKGAPTPHDLLTAFEPLAKKLRAFEDKPPEGSAITDQLMHEAQRLVHVRPKGEASKATADDLTPKVEKALAHDDLADALQAFSALQPATRAQAKEFGDTLASRRAAEEAAAALIASAIGDLDAGKE
jgi:hypothetical protein